MIYSELICFIELRFSHRDSENENASLKIPKKRSVADESTESCIAFTLHWIHWHPVSIVRVTYQ